MSNLMKNVQIKSPKDNLKCIGNLEENDGFYLEEDFIVYLGAAWSDGTDCFNLSKMKKVNIPPWIKVKPIKWKIVEVKPKATKTKEK